MQLQKMPNIERWFRLGPSEVHYGMHVMHGFLPVLLLLLFAYIHLSLAPCLYETNGAILFGRERFSTAL